MKYRDEIEFASESFDMDKSIIYSIINTESHFNKNAVSSKGAVGLMQIMFSTAKEVSGKIGLSEFDLKNPEDNILIGTAYISELIKRFDNLDVAICAYNAGPSNVSNWLINKDYSDDGKVLKEIPFAETRGYLEKFKLNLKYYKTKK